MKYILVLIVGISLPICLYLLTKKGCDLIDDLCDNWEKKRNEK